MAEGLEAERITHLTLGAWRIAHLTLGAGRIAHQIWAAHDCETLDPERIAHFVLNTLAAEIPCFNSQCFNSPIVVKIFETLYFKCC